MEYTFLTICNDSISNNNYNLLKIIKILKEHKLITHVNKKLIKEELPEPSQFDIVYAHTNENIIEFVIFLLKKEFPKLEITKGKIKLNTKLYI